MRILFLCHVILFVISGCNSYQSSKNEPEETSLLEDSSKVVWNVSLEKIVESDSSALSEKGATYPFSYYGMQSQDSILVFFWKQQYIGAINKNNGKVLWKQKAPGITILTLKTDKTSAYFAQSKHNDIFRFFSIDLISGSLKWERYINISYIKSIKEDVVRGYYQKIDSAGLLSFKNNDLYICLSENSDYEKQTLPRVYVISKSDGKIKKEYTCKFVNGGIFKLNTYSLKKGSIVVDLDKKKSILWSQLTARKERLVKDNFLSFSYRDKPQFNGNDIIFSIRDSVFSYSANKQREPWRVKPQELIIPFHKGIVLADNYVLVSSYSSIAYQGHGVSSLECFNATSGKLVWSKNINEAEPNDMKLFGGKLYMSYTPFYIAPQPGLKSYILEIDPASGQFLRKFDTDGKIHESIYQIMKIDNSLFYYSSLGNIGRIIPNGK